LQYRLALLILTFFRAILSLKIEKIFQLLGVAAPPDPLKLHTAFILCPLCIPGIELLVTDVCEC